MTVSHIIVRLQTLVANKVRPEDFAVFGCVRIHGAKAPNINSVYVNISLSIRIHRSEVHGPVLNSIKQVMHAKCEALGHCRSSDLCSRPSCTPLLPSTTLQIGKLDSCKTPPILKIDSFLQVHVNTCLTRSVRSEFLPCSIITLIAQSGPQVLCMDNDSTVYAV